MTGELGGYGERSRLRISDEDRHRVAEVLREAAGEGRLDLDELDQRLEAAYAAKTYGDLVPITVDLPTRGEAGVVAQPARPLGPASSHVVRYDTSIAVMGSSTRRGVWEIGAFHTAFGLMGGVEIDLREVVFTSRETVITAYAFWSGIDIHVNPGTRVVVDGIGIMGAFEQGRDKVEPDLGPDSPLVRVTGLALMAGVSVRRKPWPGERRRLGLPRR